MHDFANLQKLYANSLREKDAQELAVRVSEVVSEFDEVDDELSGTESESGLLSVVKVIERFGKRKVDGLVVSIVEDGLLRSETQLER